VSTNRVNARDEQEKPSPNQALNPSSHTKVAVADAVDAKHNRERASGGEKKKRWVGGEQWRSGDIVREPF
jgi:hypothetical protein